MNPLTFMAMLWAIILAISIGMSFEHELRCSLGNLKSCAEMTP